MTLLEVSDMKYSFEIVFLDIPRLFYSTWWRKLHLDGYKLAKADKPNNNNRGGVGIYFKELLVTRQVELNNLNECNIFIVCIQNEKG